MSKSSIRDLELSDEECHLIHQGLFDQHDYCTRRAADTTAPEADRKVWQRKAHLCFQIQQRIEDARMRAIRLSKEEK